MSEEKKVLLNEAQVRKFMKLANLQALTPGFVEGVRTTEEELEERRRSRDGKTDGSHGRTQGERDDGTLDEMGDGMYRDDEEEPEGEEVEMDMDAPEAEMDVEEEPEVDMVPDALEADRTVSVDDFLSALEKALEDVMGDEVDITQDEEEVDDLEPEAELDAPMDLGDEMMEADEEEDMMESVDVSSLIEKITTRVAERLVGEKLTKKEE